MRLSALTAKKFGISRRNAKELIRDAKVRIDGRIVKSDIEVEEDENIEAEIEKTGVDFNLADYFLEISGNMLFLYKPPFMHSERHRPEDPLCLSDIVESDYPDYKLISRLDYSVDGIVAAIQNKSFAADTHKKYLAFVSGDFSHTITMSNKIDADKKKKVKVMEDHTGFKTVIRKVEKYGDVSLVEISLIKAARHQVRAFLSYHGHPILGDELYDGEAFDRIMLHCSEYTLNGIKVNSRHEKSFIEYFLKRYKI